MKTPLHMILDLQHVSRWHMTGVLKQDNVASHSFRVAVIAMAIAEDYQKTCDAPFGNLEMGVCYYAIKHDMEEAWTGDIPSDVKHAVESHVGTKVVNVVSGKKYVEEESDNCYINNIIKIADTMDNYLYIKEFAMGDRSNSIVNELLYKYTTSMAKLKLFDEQLYESVHRVYCKIINREVK